MGETNRKESNKNMIYKVLKIEKGIQMTNRKLKGWNGIQQRKFADIKCWKYTIKVKGIEHKLVMFSPLHRIPKDILITNIKRAIIDRFS